MGKNVIWREKVSAAAIHLVFTSLAACVAAALIFFIWFPNPFSKMVGGTQLFLLVISCDLALGPVISLVIFNSRKKRAELIRDYMIVGILQLGALIYGVSIVADSRPAYVAFTKDRFEVVAAAELDDNDLREAMEDVFKSRSWTGPLLVGVQFPVDIKERNELLFSAVAGKDAQLMPKYYRPYESMVTTVKNKAQPISILIASHKKSEKAVDAAVKDLDIPAEKLGWLPVRHRFGFWTVLIDMDTGYPVKYLPIDPY